MSVLDSIPHTIDNVELHNSVGCIMLLSELGSPFMQTERRPITYSEAAIALYILHFGVKAAIPAMSYQRAMLELKKEGITSVEILTDMTDKYAEFCAMAIEFYESVITSDMPDVGDAIQRCINATIEAHNKCCK